MDRKDIDARKYRSDNTTRLFTILDNECCDSIEIETLLRSGVYIDEKDRRGNTPLLNALAKIDFRPDLVKLLIEYKADVNVQNYHGSTPLHIAAMNSYCNTASIELLLDQGAVVDVLDNEYYTPLHNAAFIGNIEVIKLLVDYDSDINSKNRFNLEVPLLRALMNRNCKVNVVKWLLDHGARMNVKDHYNRSPLHIALIHIKKYPFDIIKLLLDYGANVMEKGTRWNEYPLQIALGKFQCQLDVVELLLNHGADINSRDSRMNTALDVALMESKLNLVKLLLDNGADIDLRNSEWYSSIINKLHSSNFAFGTDINVTNCDGSCLIRERICLYHKELHKASEECVKLLIKYYLLRNPKLSIRKFIRKCWNYAVLSSFACKCMIELCEMDLEDITSNITLRELISGKRGSTLVECKTDEEIICFSSKIFRILTDGKYPLYCDLISAQLKRPFMLNKLNEVSVNTTVSDPVYKHTVLDCHSTISVARYLSNDDLLSLLLAFNNMENFRTFSGNSYFLRKRKKCH